MDGERYPIGHGEPFREPSRGRDDGSSSFSTSMGRTKAQSSVQLVLHIATIAALALVSLLPQTSAEGPCSPGYHAVFADFSSFECQPVSLACSTKPGDYPAFPAMSFLLSRLSAPLLLLTQLPFQSLPPSLPDAPPPPLSASAFPAPPAFCSDCSISSNLDLKVPPPISFPPLSCECPPCPASLPFCIPTFASPPSCDDGIDLASPSLIVLDGKARSWRTMWID